MFKKLFVGGIVACLLVLLFGFLVPQQIVIPVEGAGVNDWNHETFWYYPWGASVTHKGIDIFADNGTNVLSATHGIVLYRGSNGIGGETIFVLGPKWRFHYYAHLQEYNVNTFQWVDPGTPIGKIGQTGNAANRPPHLHYSIYTPIPYPWRADDDIQGWKKIFVLNPHDYLLGNL